MANKKIKKNDRNKSQPIARPVKLPAYQYIFTKFGMCKHRFNRLRNYFRLRSLGYLE